MTQNNFESSTVLISLVFFGVLGVAGCATPIHITDNFSAENGVKTLAIDAKQRVVIFATKGEPNSLDTKDKANKTTMITMTCAEPSPDALSVLSSSLGGSLQNNAGIIANIAAAASESAASIGLRTQSIQLLRDGMYRLCEAYAAQAISREEFNRQQRRYQNLMLSLLAIEQITGAVVPRQVGLGSGTSSASVGDGANDAAAAVTQADKVVSDAQTALDNANSTLTSDQKACVAAASDPTNSNCVNAAKDQADVNTKTNALQTAKAQQVTAKQALQAARAAVKAAATGGNVSFGDAIKTFQLTDASARYVAEAARTIVSTTLLASFAQEECSRLWDMAEHPGTTGPKTSTLSEKLTWFGVKAEDQPAKIEQLFKSCHDSQQALLSQTAMFTPQYGVTTPPTLSVLGGESAISIAPDDPAIDLRIVGGVPPYEATVTATFNFTKELEATTPKPKGMAYAVHISRPKGASKAGAATIFVVDAANAHFDIPITLTALAKPADIPAPASKPKPPSKAKGKDAAGPNKR